MLLTLAGAEQGLDFNCLVRDRRLAFVDGLSHLCLPSMPRPVPDSSVAIPQNPVTPSFPLEADQKPADQSPGPALRSSSASGHPSIGSASIPSQSIPFPAVTLPPGQFALTSSTIEHVHDQVREAIRYVCPDSFSEAGPDEASIVEDEEDAEYKGFTEASSTANPPVLLVFDGPDAFMALAAPDLDAQDAGGVAPMPSHASGTASMLLNLHTNPLVHSTIVSISADTALLTHSPAAWVFTSSSPYPPLAASVQPRLPSSSYDPFEAQPQSPPPTRLDTNAATLLTKLAHMSARIFSVCALDSGVARDVSGVLRVRNGDMWPFFTDAELGEESRENREMEQDAPEGEWLYFLNGDGSVRVFSRGNVDSG